MEQLVQEAVHERETRTLDEQLPARRKQPSPAEETFRRQGLAARKAKNGCLRTAAQLLQGSEGTAPPTHATVEAVWEKVAAQPPEEAEILEARAKLEAALAEQRGKTSVSMRQLKTAIRRMRLGAEPGASGLRNGLWHDLLRAEGGAQAAHAWVSLWSQGSITGQVADLWQSSS